MSPPASNPFEVLRLDPSASEEEVVRQAGRLRQRAADEQTLSAVRQAVQALTARPEERLLHQLLTHPRPRYHLPALDRFLAAFRRLPPADPASSAFTETDLTEVMALLEPAEGQPEDEVRRRAVEALWECLLFELHV
jgi:hypothetical protein